MVPTYGKKSTFLKKKYFLALLNQQLLEIKKETLFEYYIESESNGMSFDFTIIVHMLEEKKRYEDVLEDDSVRFSKIYDLVVALVVDEEKIVAIENEVRVVIEDKVRVIDDKVEEKVGVVIEDKVGVIDGKVEDKVGVVIEDEVRVIDDKVEDKVGVVIENKVGVVTDDCKPANFLKNFFILDDLLCNIIAYSNWKTDDEKYNKVKKNF